MRDVPVQAAGRWYAVIAAEYTGEPIAADALTLERCVYGSTVTEPGGAEYGAHELAKVKKLRLGLADEDSLAMQIDALATQNG